MHPVPGLGTGRGVSVGAGVGVGVEEGVIGVAVGHGPWLVTQIDELPVVHVPVLHLYGSLVHVQPPDPVQGGSPTPQATYIGFEVDVAIGAAVVVVPVPFVAGCFENWPKTILLLKIKKLAIARIKTILFIIAICP